MGMIRGLAKESRANGTFTPEESWINTSWTDAIEREPKLADSADWNLDFVVGSGLVVPSASDETGPYIYASRKRSHALLWLNVNRVKFFVTPLAAFCALPD